MFLQETGTEINSELFKIFEIIVTISFIGKFFSLFSILVFVCFLMMIFLRTSPGDSIRVNLLMLHKYLSTAPMDPRNMLYTGTFNAAASLFMVPPPLITRSECQMIFRPSYTCSGMIKYFFLIRL